MPVRVGFAHGLVRAGPPGRLGVSTPHSLRRRAARVACPGQIGRAASRTEKPPQLQVIAAGACGGRPRPFRATDRQSAARPWPSHPRERRSSQQQKGPRQLHACGAPGYPAVEIRMINLSGQFVDHNRKAWPARRIVNPVDPFEGHGWGQEAGRASLVSERPAPGGPARQQPGSRLRRLPEPPRRLSVR